jgi:hypothetical protein
MTCMRKFSVLVLFSWLLIFLDQLVVRRSLTFEFVVRSSVLWSLLQLSHKKRCSVCLYLQLFVWGFMSYYCYCVFVYAYWCPTHTVLYISSSCVHFVASFSGLFIFDCHFGFLWRLLDIYTYNFSCNIYLLWWTIFRGLKMLTEFSI